MRQTIFVFALVFIMMSVSAQENSIFFDGNIKDWNESTEKYDDADDDGDGIELLALEITNDQENLYIALTLDDELLLNNHNNLVLYLDTDRNATTGYQAGNIGAELRWYFGQRRGDFTDTKERIYHNDIGFSALPTVTSDTFEIKISRDALPDGTNPLFPDDSFHLRLGVENGDVIPNSGETLSYTFDDGLINNFKPVDLARPNEKHVRLMSYNVLHDGIMKPERQPYFRRILKAVNPDIIVLNECWDTEAAAIRAFMDATLPLEGEKGWSAIKRDAGNIIASRYNIPRGWHIHEDMRLTAALIDLPKPAFSRDFLVIGGHFRCCDANEERQREADAFAAFIQDALKPEGRIHLNENTPFMLAGDLNLVGYSQQLETLLSGEIVNTDDFGEGGSPDWDGTGLQDIVSPHTDRPVAFTWINNESSFWPGRLDFSIGSNSAFEVLKTFILETGHMSDARLQEYNLKKEDTQEASDHLPKITDLKLKEVAATDYPVEAELTVLPNPASHSLTLKVGKRVYDSVTVIAASSGKTVLRQQLSKTKSAVSFDVKNWDDGVYILQLSLSDSQRYVYKKVVIMN